MTRAAAAVALACSALFASSPDDCRAQASACAAPVTRGLKPPLYAQLKSTPATQVAVEHEVYLMGTRARLAVLERDRTTALKALETALESLEETEAILSTWREDSAISKLNRFPVGKPWPASSLCAMFDDVYRWQRATAGSFDPAIGALIRAWGIHDGGRVPSQDEIRAGLAKSGLDRLTFDRDGCTLTRTADVTLDVGAFGKGEALDRAAARLKEVAWLIDLGGQVSVGGSRTDGSPWTIDIAHPADRDQPLVRVNVRNGSLSTSAGSERDQSVNGRRVGHVLDPRTGSPAAFSGSVTVWHERGLVADILSTALYVMGPDNGISWAESHDVSALYLIPDGDDVRVRVTSSFERRLEPQRLAAPAF
jgi:thiamine biosynthesis lipoprotein